MKTITDMISEQICAHPDFKNLLQEYPRFEDDFQSIVKVIVQEARRAEDNNGYKLIKNQGSELLNKMEDSNVD